MMFSVKYRYLYITLLVIYSFLNILFTEGLKVFGVDVSYGILFAVLAIIVILVWESNRLIGKQIYNKEKLPFHPLIIHFLSSILLVVFISIIITFTYNNIHDLLRPWVAFKLALGFSFRVNLFLHCINAIVFFLTQYQGAQLEAESLKKQHAEAKFEALRNQVNPHFMFNSFNVLSALVHKDPDTASKFIDQLSDVYRYLLDNRNQKIISVREELNFLESYIYLLKIRFRDNLLIKNKITENAKEKYIAPATLQMLVENAIKHNIVSKKQPLNISIYNDEQYLFVENNIQLKQVKENSTYIGLNNIRNRYNYLAGEGSLEVQSNACFTVKLPLLTIEDEDEYSDSRRRTFGLREA